MFEKLAETVDAKAISLAMVCECGETLAVDMTQSFEDFAKLVTEHECKNSETELPELDDARRADMYGEITVRYNLRWFERDRLDASQIAYATAIQLAHMGDWDRLEGVIAELQGPRGEWIHSCGHAHEPDESCPQNPCGKYICCIN